MEEPNYTANKVIDYATDVIIASITHCDKHNEHDDHAYRYLERNNIITEKFNNNVTEMITEIKSIVPRGTMRTIMIWLYLMINYIRCTITSLDHTTKKVLIHCLL